jgi:glycosyltransferase involved in cell wall biosynthesis
MHGTTTQPTDPTGHQVVMFVYNDAEHDSRVWRAATALSQAGHSVTIIGRRRIGLPHVASRGAIRLLRLPDQENFAATGVHVGFGGGPVARVGWLSRYARSYWQWKRAALESASKLAAAHDGPTLWHGHDLTGALVAVQASRDLRGPAVYDSHELFLEAGTGRRLPWPMRRALAAIEKRVVRASAAIITVNQSIAEELSRRYGAPTPTVVMNCPAAGDEPPAKLNSPLRTALELADRPIALYHGGASPDRLRPVMAALPYVPPDVTLVVMGPLRGWGPEDVSADLADRVKFHPAVPIDELQAWVAGADIGVVVLRAAGLNEYYSTPNKLFECMNAAVPVIASNFPELERIVAGQNLGSVCEPDDPISVANALNELLERSQEEKADLRRRCRLAATETYSWEMESRKLLAVYEGLRQIEFAGRADAA